jgi:hypothetical protein
VDGGPDGRRQEANMRLSMRILPAALVALALALAAACGGGGSDDTTYNNGGADSDGTGAGGGGLSQTGGDFADLLVSNAPAALGQSAAKFSEDVESVQATFTFNMNMSEMAIGAEADFAYEAPDKAYMTMNFSSGEDSFIDFSALGAFEILFREGTIYMNTPFTGWVSMSAEDLGEDADAMQELLDGHSPFDYELLVQSLGSDVENLGEERIDSGNYTHLRVTTDFEDIMAALADSFGSDSLGGSLPTGGVSGPIVMDLWVDTQTLLPFRLSANGSFDFEPPADAEDADFFGTGPATFDMLIEFESYNEPVQIPEAPADAKSFAELFSSFEEGDGGISFDLEDWEETGE